MRVSGYPISSAPISGRGSSVARTTAANIVVIDGALIALARADAALIVPSTNDAALIVLASSDTALGTGIAVDDDALTTLTTSEWPL